MPQRSGPALQEGTPVRAAAAGGEKDDQDSEGCQDATDQELPPPSDRCCEDGYAKQQGEEQTPHLVSRPSFGWWPDR